MAGLVCLALLPTCTPCLFLAITAPTASCSQMGSTVTLEPQDRGRGPDNAAWQYSELVARDKPQMVTAVGAVQSLRPPRKHWMGLSSDSETRRIQTGYAPPSLLFGTVETKEMLS